jgi:TRAP-type mannitol/chloroaromatic compound transport system permease large subunit
VKLRKELWFGFSLMALIVAAVLVLMPWGNLIDGHLSRQDLGYLGLLMLALIVVAIMLGFPTAFTLMGMGVFFAWLAYRSVNPDLALQQTFDAMVQRTYGVMSNDVLIAVPLFLFMGYLVERAQLIDRLFHSLHLATSRVPGSLAVATIITCAVFATATGIVGAVVTLMGLLAFPAMLKAGYNIKVAAGAITAGGCLGILIPPSVLLIVYGATAGVSVVQLYAGAFFPGLMLASLYLGYIIVLAKWRPALMPPLADAEQRVPLPAYAQGLAARGTNVFGGLSGALVQAGAGVPKRTALTQLVVFFLPALVIAALLGMTYRAATAPGAEASTAGLVEVGSLAAPASEQADSSSGVIGGAEEEEEPAATAEAPAEEPAEATAQEPAEATAAEPAEATSAEPAAEETAADTPGAGAAKGRVPAPAWFWVVLTIGAVAIALIYWLWNWERHEVFKLLLTSFFPLSLLILAVLGSIVFGLATPAEAAAVGAFGGFVMVMVYRFIAKSRAVPSGDRFSSAVIWATLQDFGAILKESSFLTARTTAMVCWLFVGSGIFSAAFALLGGQELVEKWVLSLNLSPVQFLILAQFIIFILGWPLEWTEIIIIFMPIFIPLLSHFSIDPLFFGVLVALNLQTAFLSPPVAMAAFYLKGVSPPHVSLNAIFAGMIPFMGLQIVAMFVLYALPQLALWLPSVMYGK